MYRIYTVFGLAVRYSFIFSRFYPLTDDVPTLQQLQLIQGKDKMVKVIDAVAPEWEELAISFGLAGHVISTIRKDNFRDSKTATRQVLTHWLAGECPGTVSWESLVEHLDNAGFSGVAFDLQDLF